MSAPSPTATALLSLISDLFALPPAELTPDTPLFSSGRLDSFHLVELLSVVEKTYERRVPAAEVNLANFDTATRLATLLARL
jgi:acyl carrier protein